MLPKYMNKNPNTFQELQRSPVEDKSLRAHVRAAHVEARAEGERMVMARALVRGLRRKLEAERILRSWPPFRSHPRRIIIDVTHYCNLGCADCNRSCGVGQANVKENMSVAQIERFVSENIEQNRRWESIVLEGGEPTIHPQILEIVAVLIQYKRTHAPSTAIVLATNGYAKGAHKIIAKLPPEVCVNNSAKETVEQVHHCHFNRAPVDVLPDTSGVYRNGCILPCIYGLGLNRYGYYPHPVCGGIDRVFGLDLGRKSLPEIGDGMTDMHGPLCQYCGHLFDSNAFAFPEDAVDSGGNVLPSMSPSWEQAYASYQKSKPELTLY